MRLSRSRRQQARVLLRAAHGQRLEALYVLALTTGMRLGELLGLRWRDVDLEAGKLQVRHTLVRTPNGVQLSEPKSGRARRRIALTRNAVRALRQHRSLQATERLRIGQVWEDHDLVFANTIGKPLDRGAMCFVVVPAPAPQSGVASNTLPRFAPYRGDPPAHPGRPCQSRQRNARA